MWGQIMMGLIKHPADTHCWPGTSKMLTHCSAELQATAAELLGVEQTLFVPTNTMANLISVMCHCRRRGSQLLLGHECHIHVYEQGGVAQIAGVHSHPLPDLPYGTLDLTELERLVTRSLGSPYHPICELICLENTHSSSGGRVLPLEYLRQVHLLARSHGVRVHLDGARLMNAAVALGVPPAHIMEHCDSVSLCFSKGLGAPVGALVGGPKDFIEEAWHLRKALGGGMRQAGVLAAAALVGLADAEEMLQRDHQNAQRFAKGTGVPRLLRGSHRRGDQHGDGESGRAAAQGAVPAPAGRERGRGGPDRPRGACAGLPLDGAVGACRVAPGRLCAGHRAGAGKVGVRAEDPAPWPGWTELTRAGFCGPGIRERSSGSVSGSRSGDCTRTRASVKHPLWTLAKLRLRLTWAGLSESWPGLFQRGKGQVPPPTLVSSGIRGSPVCVWFTVCAQRPSLSAERPRVKP
ncbi:uncharacterized protein [Odocoileus virginianus]|uniref:Uncharacterized protein isoform X3 n=1 Tax=Odocoileus virginianus TaxID=9874 RepID=A0ABM4J7B3_ODOVR